MSIFSRLSRKRQYPKFLGKLTVVIKTERELSTEQKDNIIAIVKNGIRSREENSYIAIDIMMYLKSFDNLVVLNRNKNVIEIIF